MSATDEIGRAAGGVALFTLGLILSGIRPSLDRDIVLNLGLKNLLQPLVMLAVGVAVGLQGELLQQVFLLGVLPAATAAPPWPWPMASTARTRRAACCSAPCWPSRA